MKQLLISFILTSLFTVSFAAEPTVANDSTVNKKAKSIAYPQLHPVMKDDSSPIAKAVRNLDIDKAKTLIDNAISAANKKKESTDELERMQYYCMEIENNLQGTERIVIVDSVVVDKSDFLSRYPVSNDLGVFSSTDKCATVQQKTQLNDMVVTAMKQKTKDGEMLQIVKAYDNSGKLIEATPVIGLDVDGDNNYPFLMPDGMKFYFAARSAEGMGNYDLYVTRYDNDDKRFYKGENMGYPYNSYANDYMMVIDEENQLGWFASDRYQPAGKVCVYIFVPNDSRRTFNPEHTSASQLRNAASLRSLKSLFESYTKEEKAIRTAALERLKSVHARKNSVKQGDFEFVVNNDLTYHYLRDFKSPDARGKFEQLMQLKKNLSTQQSQLARLRENVTNENRAQILNLESTIRSLISQTKSLEKEVRKAELGK